MLAEAGFDPVYGARPLKRIVQKLLQDPLAIKMLDGEIRAGDTVKVGAAMDGELAFEVERAGDASMEGVATG